MPEAATGTRVEQLLAEVLDFIEAEDYERCATKAAEALQDEALERGPWAAYLAYFRHFAGAYRAWQISYHYTEIRRKFNLAFQEMEEQLRDGAAGPEFRGLVPVFGNLTRMLCAYTWCENSFINNDPFALREHSRRAVREEEEGLAALEACAFSGPLLERIAAWLKAYLEKNCLLHIGLNACADVYADIFAEHRCEAGKFERLMRRAEEKLRELEQQSAELSSELNAHVTHVRRHYQRLAESRPSRLSVTHGKLVLSLSAGGSVQAARRIVEDAREEFQRELRERFAALGLAPSEFSSPRLHDIFETSFGEQFLKSLDFDLPAVRISFLNDERFTFSVHVSLSAMGVCTVSFTLETDPHSRPRGLSVEEISALEACICPHAGQVKIDFAPPAGEDRVPPPPLERVILLLLIRDLRSWAKAHPRRTETPRVRECLARLEGLEGSLPEEAGAGAAARHAETFQQAAAAAGTLVDWLNEQRGQAGETEALHELAQNLQDRCDSCVYLSHLAQIFLDVVEEAFQAYARGERFAWILNPATGWYICLSARTIAEFGGSGADTGCPRTFDQLREHPDAVALILEPREARASFDDWRFMHTRIDPRQNLAYVRSHETDAFYGSDFRAFLHFPDDPMFLVAQYEATVDLINRLGTALKYYEAVSERLSRSIRRRLDRPVRRESFLKRVFRGRRTRSEEAQLRRDQKAIQRLRCEANEMRNLVSKAGISRYKDHGDLMTRVIGKMKIGRVVQLLDRHLENLNDLNRQILEEVQSSRARQTKIGIVIVSSGLGATAVKGIVEALFQLKALEELKRQSGSTVEGATTLVLMALVVGLLVWLQLRSGPSE